MPHSKTPRYPLILFLIGVAALTLSGGCEILDPPDFETYELDYRDSMTLPAPATEFVIVLEQLSDGPVAHFREVSHEVRAVDYRADSLVLHLNVVGLAMEPTPVVYADTRQEGDTLFVWYADHARIQAPEATKGAGFMKVGTTPPEPYLKVTHVEIQAPPGKEVRFLNRFIYR